MMSLRAFIVKKTQRTCLRYKIQFNENMTKNVVRIYQQKKKS